MNLIATTSMRCSRRMLLAPHAPHERSEEKHREPTEMNISPDMLKEQGLSSGALFSGRSWDSGGKDTSGACSTYLEDLLGGAAPKPPGFWKSRLDHVSNGLTR